MHNLSSPFMVCRFLRSAFPYLGRSCCGSIRKEEASKALGAGGLTGQLSGWPECEPTPCLHEHAGRASLGLEALGWAGATRLLSCGALNPLSGPSTADPPDMLRASAPAAVRHRGGLLVIPSAALTQKTQRCLQAPQGLTFRRMQGEQIMVPPAKKGPHTLCPGEFAEKNKGGHSNLWLQLQMDPSVSLASHLSPPLWGGREPKSRFFGCQMLC